MALIRRVVEKSSFFLVLSLETSLIKTVLTPISAKMVRMAARLVMYENVPQAATPRILAAKNMMITLKNLPVTSPKDSQRVFLAMVCDVVLFLNKKFRSLDLLSLFWDMMVYNL